MKIFDRFKSVKPEDFREGFQQPIKEGQAAVRTFESGLKNAMAGKNDLGKALTQLQEGVSTAETANVIFGVPYALVSPAILTLASGTTVRLSAGGSSAQGEGRLG